MKYCVACGHGNPDDSTFCGGCGRGIDSPGPPSDRGVVGDAGHQVGVAFLGCLGTIAVLVFFVWLNRC
jgi:hypothetical protein